MKGLMIAGSLLIGLLLAFGLLMLLTGVADVRRSEMLGPEGVWTWRWPQPAPEPVLLALSPAANRRWYPTFPDQGALLPREALLPSPENGRQLVDQLARPLAAGYFSQGEEPRPALRPLYQRTWVSSMYVVPVVHGL
jgi:hypothetical protein